MTTSLLSHLYLSSPVSKKQLSRMLKGSVTPCTKSILILASTDRRGSLCPRPTCPTRLAGPCAHLSSGGRWSPRRASPSCTACRDRPCCLPRQSPNHPHRAGSSLVSGDLRIVLPLRISPPSLTLRHLLAPRGLKVGLTEYHVHPLAIWPFADLCERFHVAYANLSGPVLEEIVLRGDLHSRWKRNSNEGAGRCSRWDGWVKWVSFGVYCSVDMVALVPR